MVRKWRSDWVRIEQRFGLTECPRLDEREIRLLESWDWWDGPLNGTLEYGGDVYWFDSFHLDREDSPYAVLDPEDKHYFYLVFPLAADLREGVRLQFLERDRRRAAKDWDWPAWTWLGPDLGDLPPIG